MQDVKKTRIQRDNSGKRMRRRKRRMNLYVFIVVLIVATLGITMSFTFLFNINDIQILGESTMYTAEEIYAAAGISIGDNLMRIDTGDVEQRIYDNLLYVEDATVKKRFPSTLEITVTRCIPAFNVSSETGTLLVSQKGKILENNSFVTEGYPYFKGYDPIDMTLGIPLRTLEGRKETVFNALAAEILRNPEHGISVIDMTDVYETNIEYSNGIIFRMGSWNDIPYKLSMVTKVMSELEAMEELGDHKGFIKMIGTNQCSFRKNEGNGFENGVFDISTIEQPTTKFNDDDNDTGEDNEP